jgi:hypothetical protein
MYKGKEMKKQNVRLSCYDWLERTASELGIKFPKEYLDEFGMAEIIVDAVMISHLLAAQKIKILQDIKKELRELADVYDMPNQVEKILPSLISDLRKAEKAQLKIWKDNPLLHLRYRIKYPNGAVSNVEYHGDTFTGNLNVETSARDESCIPLKSGMYRSVPYKLFIADMKRYKAKLVK